MDNQHDLHHRKQNFWNFLFSIFFLVVLTAALWEVWGEYGDFPRSVPVFDAALMALAAFRITRLVVYDKITHWFRDLFAGSQNGFLQTIEDLLSCPWCIGFWSAIIIAFCYFMFHWAWFIIFFLAIAGASSFVQILANGLGWWAEGLKLDAKRKETL